jgi:hypothetical protein
MVVGGSQEEDSPPGQQLRKCALLPACLLGRDVYKTNLRRRHEMKAGALLVRPGVKAIRAIRGRPASDRSHGIAGTGCRSERPSGAPFLSWQDSHVGRHSWSRCSHVPATMRSRRCRRQTEATPSPYHAKRRAATLASSSGWRNWRMPVRPLSATTNG